MNMATSSPTALPWRGRVAFVSGAASGIGLGLAQALAARGVRLALGDVRREALEQACAALRREGADVLAVPIDVADRAAVYAAADTVEQHFGKVHYVFNNAGVGEVGTSWDQVPDEVFDWVIDVNLRGVFNACKAFVPKLRAHGEGGHIVNTTSISALFTAPAMYTGVYSSTKRALWSLSADLREALRADGIAVSMLCPGLVSTDLSASTAALRPVAHQKPLVLPPELATAQGMPARAAGEIALLGMERGLSLIPTHPEMLPLVEREQQEIREAFEATAAWVPEVLRQFSAASGE